MTSFLSFMSENREYRKGNPSPKDSQVENGLVTGIAEGAAMALRKPEKTHEENGNEGESPQIPQLQRGNTHLQAWSKPLFVLCLRYFNEVPSWPL